MSEHPDPEPEPEPDPDEPEAATLDRLQAELATLASRIDLLTHLVTTQVATGGDEPPASARHAWNWATLPAEEARIAWAQLAGWVDQLAARYGLHETIPACWYAHPPIVEELTALRAAWFAAYHPRAKPDQAAVWHDALDRVLNRIHGWNRTGCAGTHRDEPPLATHDDDATARAAFITAEVAGRAGSRRIGGAADD
ncbi:MAG: hypothetical protein ACYCO3_07865 [Mycobacteriales bacterium]